jgi:hypothetical protein
MLAVMTCFTRTGWAMARQLNRVARQRLEGVELERLAPAGFNPTYVEALILQAIAWTAALRERLLARSGPARVVPGVPKDRPIDGPRPKQARARVYAFAEGVVRDRSVDWHNWPELAKTWRIGPSGVVEASRQISGMSNQAVIDQITENLQIVMASWAAVADLPRLAALEALARTRLAEVEVAFAASPVEEASIERGSGGAGDATAAWVAGTSPAMVGNDLGGEPPPKPPDDFLR